MSHSSSEVTSEGAEGLAVSPDGTEVWVVNRRAESISIINTATLEVVATIPASLGAGRAEISAGGRVLVPNGTSATALEKYLTVYDLASRRVAHRLEMTDGGTAPGAYSIHIVGELAFVADRAENSIAIYDLAGMSQVAIVARDHPGADGMGYSPRRVAVLNE